jgi:hypothetical protein
MSIKSGIRSISLSNTSTALGAGATYTGTNGACNKFSYIKGTCKTDQAGTLYIDQAGDGSNYDNVDTIAVAAGVGIGFKLAVVGARIRVRYTNGAVAQGYFRLVALLEP